MDLLVKRIISSFFSFPVGILKCFIIAKSGLFLCFGLQYYPESKVPWADKGVSTIPAVAPVEHTEVSATPLNHWEYQKPLGFRENWDF